VLLIAVQQPDATRVAGFGAWKQLGRSALKGEKGIATLAPRLCRGHVDEKDQSPSSHVAGDQPDRAAPALRGFRIVHVFDLLSRDSSPPSVLHRISRSASKCVRARNLRENAADVANLASPGLVVTLGLVELDGGCRVVGGVEDDGCVDQLAGTGLEACSTRRLHDVALGPIASAGSTRKAGMPGGGGYFGVGRRA